MARTTAREANMRHPGAMTFGYPVHRVADQRVWANSHGVVFVEFTAGCGHVQTRAGDGRVEVKIGEVLSARTGELCEGCWA